MKKVENATHIKTECIWNMILNICKFRITLSVLFNETGNEIRRYHGSGMFGKHTGKSSKHISITTFTDIDNQIDKTKY